MRDSSPDEQLTNRSDHFDGTRFNNLTGIAGQPFSKVPRMLRETRVRWPRDVDVVPQRPLALGNAAAVVTFVGHATFLIQMRTGNIITDPMYSMRAGPFNVVGPRRTRRPGVRFEDLPPITTVLLSHNHYDHCDVRTLRALAKRFDPLVVTPVGNARLVRSAGIRRVEELDWWESSTTSAHQVSLTPAQHFSARTPWDRNRALWGGFMIEAGTRRVYFAGDTGYGGFFPEIGKRAGRIDLALLPIGAYEPRWFMKPIHMNPAEAVQAHIDVGATQSIAMHFGTFQLTPEPIDEPVRALADACNERGLAPNAFRALGFGESLVIPDYTS